MRDLTAHLVDDPALELHHQAGLVHGGQEVEGRHESELGMTPAHERLEVIRAFVVEIDDRLVVHLELLAFHRRAELGLQPETGHHPGVHRGVEHGTRTAAARLGVVHRDVGIAQHVLGVRMGAAADRDADAGRHRDLVPVELDRRRDPRLHPLHDRPDRARFDAMEQHRELVTAEPCREIGLTQPGAQPLADRGQEAISHVVTERVVDELEAVEVEEHHGVAQLGRLAGLGDGQAQPLQEQLAIGQSRHLVVQRALAQQLLHLFARLDVVDRADDARRRTLRWTDRQSSARDVVIHTIRAAEPVLDPDRQRLPGHRRAQHVAQTRRDRRDERSRTTPMVRPWLPGTRGRASPSTARSSRSCRS